MRSILLALLLSYLAVVSATDPNTPSDGSSETDNECLLSGLEFTNQFHINEVFTPNRFHYTCSCSDPTTNTWTTVVKPTTLDPGSSVEVTFNGAQINFRSSMNGISNDGTALSQDGLMRSPRTQSDELHLVPGDNEIILGVGCNGHSTPPCYYQYHITCHRGDNPPGQGGSVVGDPQFVGLRGQNYQVHGVSGEVYNIVSDADLQYNSRFVFLSQGDCPVVNGRKQKGCFSHPGSYLGELGLKTRAGDRIHLLSGGAKTGFAGVEVNDQAIGVGESVMLADNLGSVSLNTTHLATVQIGNWDFVFENSDLYINQKVRVLDARGMRSHGLLGQTWRDATYPNAVKYIQGQVDDYVIRDNDIFGDNFVYNTHN